MADENRTAAKSVALLRALEQEPYRFGFFQALRRLECAYPERARTGTSNRPQDDPVRFGQEPSMAFAPATLSGCKLSRKGFPPRLSVLFFGLFGPNGPLPLHLTEYSRDRLRNADDPTLARFADMFHHRLLSLFYRAWADAEPTTSLDRPQDDRFSRLLGALCGIGNEAMRDRDAMPDFAKLYFTGRLSAQTRNAEGLLAVLRYYFHMPVSLQQFVGEWLTVPAQFCMRLGESIQTCALGQTTTLGARVWECQHKFRLTFGPLSMDEYQRLLPGGTTLVRLFAIVRNYAGDEFNWDINLILKREEFRPTVLGAFGQLGWTTWMSEQMPDKDPDRLYINPMKEML
jgi:type VI secretion system protein ImpH